MKNVEWLHLNRLKNISLLLTWINDPIREYALFRTTIPEKDFGDLPSILTGNTAMMFSESGNAPAKLIKEFRKKSDKPILKGAYIEQSVYLGDEQVDSLVNIKSKDELIGELITLLQSPIKNVVSSLKYSGDTLASIVKTLSEKKENDN